MIFVSDFPLYVRFVTDIRFWYQSFLHVLLSVLLSIFWYQTGVLYIFCWSCFSDQLIVRWTLYHRWAVLLLLARSLEASCRYCNVFGRHFAYISSETGRIWMKFGRGMGQEWPCKIFGEISPGAGEAAKHKPFSWWWIPCICLVTSALPVFTRLGRNMWIVVHINCFISKILIFLH